MPTPTGLEHQPGQANTLEVEVHSWDPKRTAEEALEEESDSRLDEFLHKRPRLSSGIPLTNRAIPSVLDLYGELLTTSRQPESAGGKEPQSISDDMLDCIKQPQNTSRISGIKAQQHLALSIHDRIWRLKQDPRTFKTRTFSGNSCQQSELFSLRKSDFIAEIHALMTPEQRRDCNHLITEQICAAVMLMDGKEPQPKPALEPLPHCTVSLTRMVDIAYDTHQAVKLRKLLPERVSISR